jgi:hypothetical protein
MLRNRKVSAWHACRLNFKRDVSKVSRARRGCAALLTIVVLSSAGYVMDAGVSRGGVFASASSSASVARYADFGRLRPSADARHVADWVADSRDTQGSDFVIVDKKYATVYVFDGNARLRGAAPALLGSARGDDSVPGIGLRPIEAVLPEERTTPAGRFIAERGHNARGEDVVWVAYDDAVSIHRVLVTNAEERRLERLATATVEDNRISYGCINVPVTFYESYIRPMFATRRAVVYVLPEIKSAQQVFGSYDVAVTHGVIRPPAIAVPPN